MHVGSWRLLVGRSLRGGYLSWDRVPRFPLAVIVVLVVVAGLADLINATILSDPYELDLLLRNSPPWPLEGSDPSRLLGSDALGRDIASRIVLGARLTLGIAVSTIVVGGLLGTLAGLISGTVGGWVDATLMRVVDVVVAFPVVLVALVLVTAVGAAFWIVIVLLAVVVASRFARIVRADVIGWRSRDFVSLAVVAGASTPYIVWRHMLPNVASTILVVATLQVGWVILAESTLSFLSAGVPPPNPTWGNMVADGRNYIADRWWISVMPGLAIAITVVAFNLLGDWVRDAMDPTLRDL